MERLKLLANPKHFTPDNGTHPKESEVSRFQTPSICGRIRRNLQASLATNLAYLTGSRESTSRFDSLRGSVGCWVDEVSTFQISR